MIRLRALSSRLRILTFWMYSGFHEVAQAWIDSK